MTQYLGPKNSTADLATQGDVTGAPVTNTTPDAITPDQAGAVGTSSEAARADHAHQIDAAAPSANLTASTTNAEGTATSFARSDHSHALTTGAPTSNLTASTTNAAGSSASLARADHSHAITTGTPGSIQPDATADAGTSASLARADHRHAIDAAAPSANLTASTTNSEGVATSFARSDHSHAITTGTPGTITPDDAAAAGTSASLARADHVHAIAAAAAGTITGSNAEGTSTSFARADHNHALGADSVGSAALGLTMVKATRTSAQSFTSSGAFADVTFPTEDFDYGNLHSTSTTTDRVTVDATGIWLVQAGAGFAANSTGWRAIVISVDAADQIETAVRVGAAAAQTRITTSGILSLTSGQVLRLGAAQNSGSTLNLDSAFLSAIRLR